MPHVKSVFVILVYSKPDGSVRVMLSEEDMETRPAACPSMQPGHCHNGDTRRFSHANPPQPAKFEPALDALGGKRDGGTVRETVWRELSEETGGLIPDENLRSLDAWIAALPQDSPNIYYSGAGAGGSALFLFYPVQKDEMAFWFKLHENFKSTFGQAPFDPTRKRSPSYLHWVKMVAPSTATRDMPVEAPLHQCAPDCAARCGCTECPFKSRASKTLGVKPHVAGALQHLQRLRPALLLPQPQPQQSLPLAQPPLSLAQPPPVADETQIFKVTGRGRAAAAAMLGSGRDCAVAPPAGARRAAAPLRRRPPTPPLQRPQDVVEMDEPEHTITPAAAALLEATSLTAAPPAAAPAAAVSPELANLVQQVRDPGLSQVVEDHQSVAGPLRSTPQRLAPVSHSASPRTGGIVRFQLSAPPARRAAGPSSRLAKAEEEARLAAVEEERLAAEAEATRNAARKATEAEAEQQAVVATAAAAAAAAADAADAAISPTTSAPVGFSTDVSSVGGFFLERFESYAACTRFSGCLRAQLWSLPEAFRANRTWPLGAGEGACADES